jgi:CheY-like chemotaxis protein
MPGRILLVDDEPSWAKIVRIMLSRQAYAMDHAADGEAALQHLRTTGPCDLILLDLMMTGMDGWTLLRLLRETPAFAAIPVILQTGIHTVTLEEACARGAQSCLSKPYTRNILLHTINSLLPSAASKPPVADSMG